MNRRGRLILALLLGSAILAPPADAASTSSAKPGAPIRLTIRAALHDGFGRLVFATTTGPVVPFSIDHDDNRVTLHFARPVIFSASLIDDKLQGYLAQTHLSADGLTLTARLTRAVTLQPDSPDDQTRTIDFVVATPPAKQKLKDVPLGVGVRVGSHDTFQRLVLEWPQEVTGKIVEKPGSASILFDKAARLDARRIDAALPKTLRPFKLAADGRSISFALPKNWHPTISQGDRKIIVDIGPGPASTQAPPASPPPAVAPVAPTPAVAKTPSAAVKPPPPAQPATAGQAAPATPQVSAAALSAALAASEPKDTEVGIATGATPESNIGGSFGSSGDLRVIWSLAGEGLTLRFEWGTPTSAAIFRRGGSVWIVFDRAETLDLGQFQAQNLPVVSAIDQVPVSGGMALRLSVWQGFNPSVTRAGNAWIVDLKNTPSMPTFPLQSHLQQSSDGAEMAFPAFDPSAPLSIADPEVGDQLVVVPLPQLGQGIERQSLSPDLVVMPSAQGLVLRPLSDQLTVRSEEDSVTVSEPGGLLVSPDADRVATSIHPAKPSGPVLDFPAWVGTAKSGDDFYRLLQSLEHAVLVTDGQDKLAARVNLAKFYIANGLGAEALGVVGVIGQDTPEALNDPQLRAIRGVANEQMSRATAALADLKDAVFDTSPDVALWRGAALADQQDWKDAVTAYQAGRKALASVPTPLRRRLDLKFAEALIDTGDRDGAQSLLDDVLASNPIKADSDAAKILEGRILGVEGNVDRATELWQEVSDSELSSLARAEAGYALVMTNLDSGKISRLDAIEALDRMRFDWRGDDFEVRLLRKMGQLQYDDGDYHGALNSFRQILTYYANNPNINDIAAEMQQDFTSVFVGPHADSVPPITALGIFQEFKILTPPGAVGDAVARNLIDRLVGIDLLDRAAGALELETRTRLRGIDQARAATELALLQLLQNKPDDAKAALAIPLDGTPLAPMLIAQRQEFTAGAAFLAGDGAATLKLLDGDSSADADKLRADVYWSNHDWKSVAGLLKARIPAPQPNMPLDPSVAGMIMNAATAMALSNDQAGLAAMNSKYGAAMVDTANANDFSALVGSGVPNPATLSNFGQQVGGLRSFIESWRQKLANSKLSVVLG